MPNEKDYAIVIGVEYYKGMNQLGGPHRDVNEFIDWLKKPSGGDIPETNLGIFLSTPTFIPSQDDIDSWLDDVMLALQKKGLRGRRLYFYFSGHGIGVNSMNSAMLLPKWSSSMRNYALSSEKYLVELRNKAQFEEIYFFMDCCRNRIPGVTGQQPLWAAPAPSNLRTEFMLCYAAEFDSVAYEASPSPQNPTLNNLLPRGLFTRALIDALSGAAAGRDGNIRVSDLNNYLKRKLVVPGNESQSQNPRMTSDMEFDKIILGPLPSSFDITIEFKTDGKQMILEDPELRPVHEGNSSDKTWKLTLKRGEHILREKAGATEMKLVVDGLQNHFVL